MVVLMLVSAPLILSSAVGAENSMGGTDLQRKLLSVIVASDSGLAPSVPEWKKARREISKLYREIRAKRKFDGISISAALRSIEKSEVLARSRAEIRRAPLTNRRPLLFSAARELEVLLRTRHPEIIEIIENTPSQSTN